ncbi:hypothetical protein POTOM_059555 [Populus tomentosa]|uniref:Pentatricopeptide repeat-containing protein n=1 Tax=Populus tomentosa TaxID=118781 RepID=A0A8X8C006_POPTO|nr:hypothetical protein POTOM_059555 [Populus tomentosa]
MSKIIKLGFQPDIVTFSTLINGLCTAGKAAQAVEFFYDFVARGSQPNVHTYTTIINGLWLQPNFQICTTIINTLCKEGLVDEAFEAFRKMEEDGCSPDEWSYNVIIRGFLQHKDASRVVQLIGEMRDKGFFADARTKALVMDLLSSDENLENSSNHLLFFHVFH